MSLCVQELCHPLDFLWILAATPGYRHTTGLSVLSWFHLYLIWGVLVGLGAALDDNLSQSSSCTRVWLSFGTVVIVEIDELEEDVGWLLSCLESVIEVEGWELEEELDDKPGTTIGKKFSVLHCIRILSLMRCYPHPYSHWSIHRNARFHRKACRAIILLACFRRSNSLTYTVASSNVCTSPLAFMTVVGLNDFVKVSISAEFNSSLLITCIDAPESQQIIVPQVWDLMQVGTYSPKVRRILLCFSPSVQNTFLTSFRAASRALCSCHSVSSWDRSSNFGALGLLRSSFSPVDPPPQRKCAWL